MSLTELQRGYTLMQTKSYNFIVYILVSLAICVALFILWAGWLETSFPYDGFNWFSQSGEIETIDSEGPVFDLIEPDDRVIAVNGLSIPINDPLYQNKRPGDIIILTVKRQENFLSMPVVLSIPPWNVRLARLFPILVSFGFWLIGTYIFSYQPHDVKGRLFLLVCLVSSLALAAGSSSVIGPEFAKRLFNISLCWLVPLIVSFHMVFPKPNNATALRYARSLLIGIATISSTYQVILGLFAPNTINIQSGLYIFHRIWLTLGLFIMVYLLIQAYRSEVSDISRRQVGIVTLGGSAAILMFLGFALIPNSFLGKPILPYNLSFVFVLLIPLSYVYAIKHFHLIPIDRYVSRMISSSLTVALLLSLLLLAAIVMVRILPTEAWKEPFTLLTIMLGIILLGVPLKRKVSQLVERLFYGQYYDFRTTIQKVSQLMQEPVGHLDFNEVLLHELVKSMQLECACIFLSNGDSGFRTDGFEAINCANICSERKNLTNRVFLDRQEPVPMQVVRQEMENVVGSRGETDLLFCEQAHLLVPLHGSRGLLGAILTGPKTGKGEISKDEQEILQVIARQAGIAIENINLAAKLRQRNQECVRLNHQVLQAGETERKRLAWELHDQTIQSLTGIGYRLAELRYHLDNEEQPVLNQIQENVFDIIHDLRRICTDLRPPLLDTLGLVAAIRSLLRNYGRESEYRVTLEVNGEEEEELPEEIEICIYRSLQEILHNAQKYSMARLVQVKLSLGPRRVFLHVEDDGKGFDIPKNLGQFSMQGHFGLMGIKERVEMLAGILKVESAPGIGCRITMEIPLQHDVITPTQENVEQQLT